MSTFLSQLNWRRAVKSFDRQKPVPESDIKKILEAIHMAPTSFGLQPFRVEVIKDAALKTKLQAAAWNQDQITSSSTLLVFVADAHIEARINDLFEKMSGGQSAARENLKPYEGMMRGALLGRSPEELKSWAAKQAYIALGFAMAAAAELKVDCCPMEGFSGADFDKILGLPAGHSSSVVLAIGYRSTEVPLNPPFHFPQSAIFNHR
jgi:nitroreductase/dihydropteridine reductase